MKRADVILETWAARPKEADTWDFKRSRMRIVVPTATRAKMKEEHPRYRLPRFLVFAMDGRGKIVGRLDDVAVDVAFRIREVAT
jgi:hypothetical protein